MLAFVNFSRATDHLLSIFGIEWVAGILLFGLAAEFFSGVRIFSAMDVRPWKNGKREGFWYWDEPREPRMQQGRAQPCAAPPAGGSRE
jgi:hypothetical protein